MSWRLEFSSALHDSEFRVAFWDWLLPTSRKVSHDCGEEKLIHAFPKCISAKKDDAARIWIVLANSIFQANNRNITLYSNILRKTLAI